MSIQQLIASYTGSAAPAPAPAPAPPLDPAYVWQWITGYGSALLNSGQRAQKAIGGGGDPARTSALPAASVYCEFEIAQYAGGGPFLGLGIINSTGVSTFYNTGAWTIFTGSGGCGLPARGYSTNGATTSDAAYAYTTGDRIGIAVDLIAGKIWYSKNGTWISGDPAAGTSPTSTFTPGGTWYFAAINYDCTGSGGSWLVDIFPNVGTQLTAAPTGFTPFQP